MLDYVKWRGGLSFRTEAFNEVDNLIFAQLIYAEMDHVLKPSDKITIGELHNRFFQNVLGKPEDFRSFGKDGVFVLRAIGRSDRFKDCVVYNYENKLHADTTEQFSAMMIDLPDKTTVVCFKGTDEHMIGWKEDCYLSYKDIAGQSDAVDYVNRNCSPLKKYRVIGHSKGGNLAVYAAVHCKPVLRHSIIQVISDDGPGLRGGSFDQERYDLIKDKYQLIVPEKDAIGTIYEMAPRRIIAHIATKNIIEAHGMMTWQVMGKKIVAADADSFQTDRTRKAILQFLKDTTPEQREIFVEEMFKAFDDAGITTVMQLASGGLPVIVRVIKELSEMDGIAKNIAVKLAKMLSISVSSGLYKAYTEGKETIKNKASGVSSNIGSFIDERMSPFGYRKKQDAPEAGKEETEENKEE